MPVDCLEFSYDGALEARKLIDELLEQASQRLESCFKQRDKAGWDYWLARVRHLINEHIKIDLVIWKLRAVVETTLKN